MKNYKKIHNIFKGIILKVLNIKFEQKQTSQSWDVGVRISVQNGTKWWRHHEKLQKKFHIIFKGIILKVLNTKFEQKGTTKSGDIGVRISVPKRYQMMTSSWRITKIFFTSF